MQQWQGALLVLTGSACYGVLSTLTKLAYAQGFATSAVVGCQVLFGVASLLVTSRLQWRTLLAPSKRVRWWLFVGGMLSGLTGIFYYLSLRTLGATEAVVVLFQFTWMGMLWEWLWRGNKPAWKQVAGLALVLTGTWIASGGIRQDVDFAGIALALTAAACYALFLDCNGNVGLDAPSAARTVWMAIGTAVLTYVVFPPRFLFDGQLGQGLWLWGLGLGVFGIALPYCCLSRGVPLVGTAAASLLGAVELPAVALVAFLVLDERLSGVQLLGIGVLLGGVLLSSAGKQASLGKPKKTSVA